jgi:hypothetical protein
MTKLYIVTVATEIKYYMKYLMESVKINGGELIILGLNEKWQGFNWRNKLIFEYISKLDDDNIICFVDGYDVLCVKKLSSLTDEFYNIKKRENCKMIVGYENKLNIYNWLGGIFMFNGSPLNAGTYISTVKDLKTIISKILENNKLNSLDDQILLIEFNDKYPNDIYIDSKSELFLTLVDACKQINVNDIYVENKIIYNNNNPYFIHCAGNTCMDNLIIKMGFSKNSDICKDIIINNNTKVFYYFWYFIDIYGIYFLIIIFIIILIIKK